jgi:hypothetical protein
MRRKLFDSQGHACFMTFSCYRRRSILAHAQAKQIVIHSRTRLKEKLSYIHANPVKAGLVEHVQDWKFGSARYYLLGKSVGVPITPMQ